MNKYQTYYKHFALLTLLCGLILSNSSFAQTPTSLAAGTASVCPPGFERLDQQKLCVSDKFNKPAFKNKRARPRCAEGYAKVVGVRQCILDKKTTRLSKRGEYLIIRKSEKNRCGANYRRASKSNICVDKQLAINVRQAKLVLEKQLPLNCLPSNQKSCQSLCRPGYLKPLGLDMCVAFNLAKQGHPGLKNPDPDCAGSDHWHKVNSKGLCIPKLTLVSHPAAGPSEKLAVTQGDFECPEAQVLIVQLPSGEIQFQVQVIACSPPGVGK